MSHYPQPLPRIQHLASSTLPAAGAFTSQALYKPDGGLPRLISFWVTYTRGADGGYPRFRVEWSNGTETSAADLVIDDTLDVATPPFGRQNGYIHEVDGPAPANGDPIEYRVIMEDHGGAIGVRLLVAEAGVTGTPGVCSIAIGGRY
jgi:hypothetical protein